ncbi:hypothetical protein [Dyella ginsengisoli]|uniref:hypothetical protein n=1 Tax=Dyella ginsengisoli TaxID=363848 RepID=UPI00036162A0|nr:hypothetical protein [Dyella ginsengisoli]
MSNQTNVGLTVVQAHYSQRRTLRDKISRWLTPPYMRYLAGQDKIVVLVGDAGSGKTTILRKAKLALVDGQPSKLPSAQFAIDEPAGEQHSGSIRNRLCHCPSGFALAVQSIKDIETLGVLPDLAQRPSVEFFVMDDGTGRRVSEARSWISQHWPVGVRPTTRRM